MAAAAIVAGAALPVSACGGDARGAAPSDLVRVPANLCALLTAPDIGAVAGRPFPAPRRTQAGSGEQDCTSVSPPGAVSFTLFWGNCVDGKAPNMDCLNSVSGAFATHKQQTVGAIQPIAGLGDQAFCTPAPFATAKVLKGWIYLTVTADTCSQAQKLAGTLLAKLG